MSDAFKVDTNDEFTNCGISDIPTEAHNGLRDILASMQTEENPTSGGELTLRENITGREWRLTFCEWTGLKVCPFCNGTGAQD